MVLLVAPAPAPVEASQIVAVPVVVEVFSMVRLAPPVLIPSMIILSAPFSLINADAVAPDVPEMVTAVPAAGLMVNVLAPAAALALITIGKVSPAP